MALGDPLRSLHADRLAAHVYRGRADMGEAAASRAAECLRAAVVRGGGARAVFASAPSQVECGIVRRSGGGRAVVRAS
jgi:hypothetical protein